MTYNSRSKPFKTSVGIAMSAILSALAIVLTIINLTIPFPILPYLKFDFSEIPVTIALLLLGPVYGLLSAVIYWIVLTIRAGDILGPAMKFAAVASMMAGFWIASTLYRRTSKGNDVVRTLSVGFSLGSLLRVAIMSVFNYVVLIFIAPYYLDFVAPLLGAVGLPSGTSFDVLLWTLILTAVYNLIHTFVSMLPAYLLARVSFDRIPGLVGNSWILQITDNSGKTR